MKVLIAIDSFKGSLSSQDGSMAIGLGIRDIYPDAEIVMVPLADGGEGTVEALVEATNGSFIEKEVIGPLQDKVSAIYGILGDKKTAVIEVAAACGLPLIPPDKRNPMITTTYGVGELIIDAINKGCREFIIGLGGSSTNDAGIGMLKALGYSFRDENNQEVGFGGRELKRIISYSHSNVSKLLKDCKFKIACDVSNPLYGPLGAAYIFAPQKGATTEMVKELDKGLMNLANVVYQTTGKDINKIIGSGAAGGLGAAFGGVLQAEMQSGIELILEMAAIKDKLIDCNFVITGEGRLDGQTSMGKAPIGVAKIAKEKDIPVLAFAGGVTNETVRLHEYGITAFFSILNEPMTLENAMDYNTAFNNLRSTAGQVFRVIKALT